MHASALHKMNSEISADPEVSMSGVQAPNNAWGFAGYVLAKFGPWGAILIILAAVMWFSLKVYNDSQHRNDSLVQIIQQQGDTAIKQAVATAEQSKGIADQTHVISDLREATAGLKMSVDQMRSDFRDSRYPPNSTPGNNR